ncbi:hypothetical protein ABIE69_003327 [Rhodobacteraceae bacterium MBR-64]
MSEITTVGLDLAKNVFQMHGADASGGVVLRKKLRRDQVLAFFSQMPPCVVAMEACGGAHFRGCEIGKLGHEVRLIRPAYMKPFVKRQKNDAADAEAICEAATRPTMRFVPVKSEARAISIPPTSSNVSSWRCPNWGWKRSFSSSSHRWRDWIDARMLPRPHPRHCRCHLDLAQHPARQQPIPDPIQRLPPIVIAAPGGCDLLRMRPPGDRAGEELYGFPGAARCRASGPDAFDASERNISNCLCFRHRKALKPLEKRAKVGDALRAAYHGGVESPSILC